MRLIRLLISSGTNSSNLDVCFKYRQNNLTPTPVYEQTGVRLKSLEDGSEMEVHFGKPVVARVRKCRLVVVKKRRPQEDTGAPEYSQ
jgi:hypothetical protein